MDRFSVGRPSGGADGSEAGSLSFSNTESSNENWRPGDGASEIPRFSSARTLAIVDLVAALLIVVILTALIVGPGSPEAWSSLALGVGGALVLSASLWWRNAYVVNRSVAWEGNLRIALSSVAGVVFGMVTAAWFFETEPQQLWQLGIAAAWIFSISAARYVFARRQPVADDPVRVVVAGNTGDALATRLALRADDRTNYLVEGFVMDHLDNDVPDLLARMALGSIDQLSHVAQRVKADLVVVCLGVVDAERFSPLVRELNVLGIDVALSTGLSNVALRRVSLGHISGRPLVRVTPAPLASWQLGLKRSFDVAGAILLMLATAPIMLFAALAIKVEDGGSPIYSQTRVGKDGKPFRILKFRTMFENADQMMIDLRNDHEGPVFKMTGDPRITKVGNVLRKTSMDELPQLVNIIRGEMSLVGPRPLPVHEVEAAPVEFLDRQAVKPGLTGRWQVSGRSDTGFKELDELDRWYVDNWSLGQDLEILARTVPAVLLARGAR